ncbi:ADP-ribose pyrophosphatase YjhB (NUDIX family) [Alkalibacillus filiformis]|uniref:ADP-ribose pyrophosphatase YjhB (NUDIX family) n=1 Tax=Alkalibacillus filiformis TaxID=200990 RepID=A0ABU0DP89_9BACI|nr:NUDIX hydrolase [Alkalibacillus filiformis]MDQ0350251.1 ADP-ribose pyrophosphatase YjhB (NUDIX family) [Alkalibacillus filiformis]
MGYIKELRELVGHRPLIFVGAVILLENNEGKLLLQQRKFPHGAWGLPGGLMELGESTEDVARRELKEETNLEVGKLNLINVYSGPDQYIKAENGDEFYVVTISYYANDFTGEIKADLEESIQFSFFSPEQLPDHMVGSHRMMIEDYLTKK